MTSQWGSCAEKENWNNPMGLESSYPIITVLKKIISSFGESILDDRQRFLALLNDYYPYKDLSYNLVCIAHAERLEKVLSQGNILYEVLLKKLSSLLNTKYGIDIENAQLAVEIWAETLEIRIPEKQEKHAGSTPNLSKKGDQRRVVRNTASTYIKEKKAEVCDSDLILSLTTNDITCSPDALWWYQHQAYSIMNYLIDDKQRVDEDLIKKLPPLKSEKPILLIGHEKFGGSFLVQWAIREAESALAAKSRKKEKRFFVINVDLLDRDEGVLQITIENFFRMNNKNRTLAKAQSKDFKRVYEDILSGFPIKEIKEYKRKKNWKVQPATTIHILGVEITIGMGNIAHGDEITYIPKKPLEQLIDCLRSLAIDLPDKLRDKSIKIILIVDRLERWNQIKQLEPLFVTKGALRTIIVLDKRTHDQWLREEHRRWIERNLNVIYCPQLWNQDIASWILSNYFSPNRNTNRICLNQVVEGLNFLLAGAPGNFKRIVTEHEWVRYCSESILKLPVAIVQKYTEAAKYTQVLKESQVWFPVVITHENEEALENHQNLDQRILHSILREIYTREKQKWSDEEINKLVRESMLSAGILMGKNDIQRITFPLIEQLQKHDVFLALNSQ